MRSFHGRFDGLVDEFEARLVSQLDQRQIDGGHVVSETRMMQPADQTRNSRAAKTNQYCS
jgi:hypothetical protein